MKQMVRDKMANMIRVGWFVSVMLLAVATSAQNLIQSNIASIVTPQYMASGTSTRLPVMFRLTVSGLTASTVYRYYPNLALATDFGTTNSGAGNPLMVNSAGTTFIYSTGANLTTAGNHETFTTDASGNYTGWFGIVNTGNARFTAGNTVFPTLTLALNSAPAVIIARYASTVGIKVLAWSASAGANNGTLIKGSSTATTKNIVVSYDNISGTGQPLSCTVVESIGVTIASIVTGYGTTASAWNTIIPNTNANGVRKIDQLSITSAASIGCATDLDGTWPSGAITVNPAGGTTTPINITNSDAPLNVSCSASTPTKLVITSISPSSPVKNGSFTVTVQSQDATNAVAAVTSNTGVTISLGGTGVLSGTLTGTINAGTNSISFSGLSINTPQSGATIIATRTSGDALTTGTSASFTVQDVATNLVLKNVPTAALTSASLSTFTVEAQTSGATVDNSFTGNITINKVSGPGVLGGTATVAAVAGIATFSNISFNQAGSYTINATTSGLTDAATSAPISIASNFSYTWNVSSGSWSTPASWSPARTTVLASDILIFNGSVSPTATVNIDLTSQTVGQLKLTNNASTTFSTTSTGGTINVDGGISGDDFVVEAGSSLTFFSNGTNPVVLNVTTGETGKVDGSITFNGTSSAAHRLTAADASGITFTSTGTFTVGSFFAGNAFGAGTANSIVFNAGATYTHNNAGANPFGLSAPASVVAFNPASTMVYRSNSGFSTAGRTFPIARFTNNSSNSSTSAAQFAGIIIDAGSSLTLSGTSVNTTITGASTINGVFNFSSTGTLTNNGVMTIGNTGTVMGSVNNFAGTGSYVVQRTLAGAGAYSYLSSPITSGNLSSLTGSIYRYAENGRNATDYTSGWVTASGAMTTGLGYAGGGSGSVSFSGTVNNGTLSPTLLTLTNTQSAATNGWNLLGNPYPSAIGVTNFLSGNTLRVAGAGVYLWNGTNYTTLNSGVIPSSQGFFVQATAAGAVSYTNAMRNTTGGALNREGNNAKAYVSLVNPSSLVDKTQIEFRDDASDNFEVNYDAYKLKGNTILQLFSKISDNEYDFAINILSPLATNKAVQLGYDASVAGVYTLKLDSLVALEEASVSLEDKTLAKFIDLKANPVYTFSSAATKNNQRFALHFNNAKVTGIDAQNNATFQVYSIDKMVYVNTSTSSEVVVYDLAGQVVARKAGNGLFDINLSNKSAGIYIVNATNQGKSIATKIVIQ